MHADHRPLLAPLIRSAVAVALLCLGVIGLVLPLIPGIPLLIVGALLLRRRTPGIPGRSGLSFAERLQLQVWLVARRITTSAESIRLARTRRKRL